MSTRIRILVSDDHPDVVVMDVAMPELNGIEATRRIRTVAPSARVLALSVHRDGVYVREIVRAGSRRIHIERVCRYRAHRRCYGPSPLETVYRSPEIAGCILKDYRRQATDPLDCLSPREREILQLVAEGLTNKNIAARLNLSVYTVDGHRTRVMEKLGLHVLRSPTESSNKALHYYRFG